MNEQPTYSVSFVPTTYIFLDTIPQELEVKIPEELHHFEGFGYFPKKLINQTN